MTSIVAYNVGTYSGTVIVDDVNPDDETDHVIARARRILTTRAGGSLPFGAESWAEVSRVDERDEP